MILPATPILPDFTAAPSSVWSAFGTASLAGLGCDCSEVDDSGNCLDPDPCTTDTSGSSGSGTTGPPILTTSTTGTTGPPILYGAAASCDGVLDTSGDCISSSVIDSLTGSCGSNSGGGFSCNEGSNSIDIPASTISAYANFPTSTTGWYYDAAGNIIVPMASGGGYYTITPSGTLISSAGSTAPAQSSSYGSGSAATAAQAALIQNAITQAGAVAKILALSPGESVSANGTITYRNTSLSSLTSSSTGVLLIGGVAALVVLFAVMGRK